MRPSLAGFRHGPKVARGGALVIAAALMLLLSPATSDALSIPVTAPDGTPVGTIDVGVSAGGDGIVGGFTSTHGDPASLDDAAKKCGEHHFNWFQVVVADTNPPNGTDGNPVTPPYIDPPTGGYQNQWADGLPWYWDEGDDPEPGTPGWEDGYHLDDNLEDTNGDGVNDKLKFVDYPYSPPPTHVEFNTWLVSCNEDGSLHSFHGGFSWTYDNPPAEEEAPAGLEDLERVNRNIFPTGAPQAALLAPLTEAEAWPWMDQLVPWVDGDANHDWVVNALDVSLLAANWQQPGGWEQGNFNFNDDGIVNALDVSLLAANWQYGVSPIVPSEEGTPIPEPTSLVLLAWLLLSFVALRRR